ncbi:MAG: FxsA family protein [Fidelibacterota bacterium]
MLTKLLLIFIGLPFVEMMILIKLGQTIGFWPTMLLVIATGVVGAALAKTQGLRTWYQIQRELEMGKLPAGKLVDGLLILVGGIVLLTPGLLTDLLGFILLIPTTRNVFKQWLQGKLAEMAREGETRITTIIR